MLRWPVLSIGTLHVLSLASSVLEMVTLSNLFLRSPTHAKGFVEDVALKVMVWVSVLEISIFEV